MTDLGYQMTQGDWNRRIERFSGHLSDLATRIRGGGDLNSRLDAKLCDSASEVVEMLSSLEGITKALLLSTGHELKDGLEDTPGRVARFWKEFLEYDPGNIDVGFQSVETDQMVAVTGMRVWSICEHHLLPFWCDVSIGYLTGDKVIGLSKFARIAHKHAHRLQIQERLVQGIADEVMELAGTEDVAVVARGVHTCMVMRGITTMGVMTSSSMRGLFRAESDLRSEFLTLIQMEAP